MLYLHDHLGGVIDLGRTHLDSRPDELAIARTCHSPGTIDAYRPELACDGWLLRELEEEDSCGEPRRSGLARGDGRA